MTERSTATQTLPPSSRSGDVVTRTLRSLLLALLYFGMIGAAAELYLLEHFERWQQWIPFIVLMLGFIAATMVAFKPARATVLMFRLVMALFVAAGATGVFLHYRGNVEFELEMAPAMKGVELIWNALTGATPVGAPGFMTQLGLLGMIYTYRHPQLARAASRA